MICLCPHFWFTNGVMMMFAFPSPPQRGQPSCAALRRPPEAGFCIFIELNYGVIMCNQKTQWPYTMPAATLCCVINHWTPSLHLCATTFLHKHSQTIDCSPEFIHFSSLPPTAVGRRWIWVAAAVTWLNFNLALQMTLVPHSWGNMSPIKLAKASSRVRIYKFLCFGVTLQYSCSKTGMIIMHLCCCIIVKQKLSLE